MAFPLKPSPNEVQSALLGLSRLTDSAIRKTFRAALEQMLVLYYPPFRAADDAELLGMTVTAITAYVEELSRFDEDRITRAWADVRSRHKTQGWPVLGVIVDACCVQDAPHRHSLRPAMIHRDPPKAREDYSYQLEKGIIEPEQVERLKAFAERPRDGEQDNRTG